MLSTGCLLQEDCWTYHSQLCAAKLLKSEYSGLGAHLQFASRRQCTPHSCDLVLQDRVGYVLQHTRGPSELLEMLDIDGYFGYIDTVLMRDVDDDFEYNDVEYKGMIKDSWTFRDKRWEVTTLRLVQLVYVARFQNGIVAFISLVLP